MDGLDPVPQIAAILMLGVGAQWIAAYARVPSILLLLLVGWIAGPVTGMVDPERLMGELLTPFVSVAVALILFEGGMSLRLREIQQTRKVIWRLVTLGALITWLVAGLAAHYILGLSPPVATLLGAILIVTGPTVVLPLLRHVRPESAVAGILRWEGIVIDPVGATAAVLVYESIALGAGASATNVFLSGVLSTLLVGTALSAVAAGFLILMLRRYWLPEQLQSPATLAIVVFAFALSNQLQHEAGLLTVTLIGIILANQRLVAVKHVLEFKENLRVLLLAALFILLAARLEFDYENMLSLRTVAFIAVLILIARPLGVFMSTLRSPLSWQQRLFLCWMAPRGIVAASISSIFALRLAELGYEDANAVVPVIFFVIASTVLIYGTTASFVARRLGVAKGLPQGVLIVGASKLGRDLGTALQGAGVSVTLVDSNFRNVAAARQQNLRAYLGDILSEDLQEELPLEEISNLLALTANDEVNSLAAMQFIHQFERSGVYQLPVSGKQKRESSLSMPRHLVGRILFGEKLTYDALMHLLDAGATFKATRLTPEHTFESFRQTYGNTATPLFLISDAGRVRAFTVEDPPKPEPGQRLISLVSPATVRPE